MKKNIYIIDSINTAIAVSILIKKEKNSFEIILEKKIGIDDLCDYEPSLKFIYSEIANFLTKTIWVPNYYFLGYGESIFQKIKKGRAFKRKILQIFPLKKNLTYIGPRTSSIMMAAANMDCKYIDHGYGEYAERTDLINKSDQIHFDWSRYIKNFKLYIAFIIGMPVIKMSKEKIIYSLCRLNHDCAIHLNFMEVSLSNEFISILSLIKKTYFQKKNPILFLPASDRHSQQGIPSYNGDFDIANYQLIVKHCSTADFILIKFHGILYLSDRNPKTKLADLLRDSGYDVLIIDEFLPIFLRGQIPAELLIKEFDIKKVVTEVSATVFNIAHLDGMSLVCDMSISPAFLERNFKHWLLIKSINRFLKNKIDITPKDLQL
jgi:hypothetical protein